MPWAGVGRGVGASTPRLRPRKSNTARGRYPRTREAHKVLRAANELCQLQRLCGHPSVPALPSPAGLTFRRGRRGTRGGPRTREPSPGMRVGGGGDEDSGVGKAAAAMSRALTHSLSLRGSSTHTHTQSKHALPPFGPLLTHTHRLTFSCARSNTRRTHTHSTMERIRGSVRPDGDRVLSYLRKHRGFAFASPSSSCDACR